MFDAWPSVALLALLLILWIECRLLAGRTTMAARRFFFAFLLGCVGASVLAMVLHRIGVGLTDADTEPYTSDRSSKKSSRPSPSWPSCTCSRTESA